MAWYGCSHRHSLSARGIANAPSRTRQSSSGMVVRNLSEQRKMSSFKTSWQEVAGVLERNGFKKARRETDNKLRNTIPGTGDFQIHIFYQGANPAVMPSDNSVETATKMAEVLRNNGYFVKQSGNCLEVINKSAKDNNLMGEETKHYLGSVRNASASRVPFKTKNIYRPYEVDGRDWTPGTMGRRMPRFKVRDDGGMTWFVDDFYMVEQPGTIHEKLARQLAKTQIERTQPSTLLEGRMKEVFAPVRIQWVDSIGIDRHAWGVARTFVATSEGKKQFRKYEKEHGRYEIRSEPDRMNWKNEA